MNIGGGAEDIPSPPPRAICVDYKGSELIQCARALCNNIFCQECDRLPKSIIEFICSISLASVIAREVYTETRSMPRSKESYELVLKMLEDPAIMIPELRRTFDFVNELWGDNCVTAALTVADCLDIMFGKQSIESSREANDDDFRDGGSLRNGLTSGVVGGSNIGLVELQSNSATSDSTLVHVDRGNPLSPKEWQHRRKVRGSASCDVLVAQTHGRWVVAFPMSSPISKSAVRRRCIIIPISPQGNDDEMQDSGLPRTLRELLFENSDASVSDRLHGNENCGGSDPVGFADGMTVEQLLNALVLGFTLASMIKVGLFFVNCDFPYDLHSQCSRFDEIHTCDDISRGPSRQSLYDMGTCFVFGPQN